jgi:secreted PhoX family phosphatase
VQGDAFACPGALALDARGRLWIGTAMDSAALGQPGMARLGNNQLLACDPVSGEVRRLLTGPVNSALGGLAFTPDGRTLFVNITHPGETPGGPSNPAAPQRHSAWPDFTANGRPRSATLALRRQDGAVVGS